MLAGVKRVAHFQFQVWSVNEGRETGLYACSKAGDVNQPPYLGRPPVAGPSPEVLRYLLPIERACGGGDLAATSIAGTGRAHGQSTSEDGRAPRYVQPLLDCERL